MATRLQNPFSKKTGFKKEVRQDLHTNIPQREEEAEEYINEYCKIEEAPRNGPAIMKKDRENSGERNKS